MNLSMNENQTKMFLCCSPVLSGSMHYHELQAHMEFGATVTTAHRSGAGIKYQPKNDYMETWTFYT